MNGEHCDVLKIMNLADNCAVFQIRISIEESSDLERVCSKFVVAFPGRELDTLK